MADARNGGVESSDTGRALAFSDGIFAIVITLLVIDLRPPEFEPGQLINGLLQQWPSYLAYVTSYTYIAVVWLNHKYAFSRIRAMNQGLHWANLGILFTTALLPFPTAVVAVAIQHGNLSDQRLAVGLYGAIGALMCVSWLVFFRFLAHHPGLLHQGVKAQFFRQETARAWVGILLYISGGALGYFVTPAVALAIFLALPIFYAVTSHGLYQVGIVLRRH